MHPQPNSIAAASEADLALVLQQQSVGPYLLAGYCSGGAVAFEVARRLQELGQAVPLLVLIESVHCPPPSKLVSRGTGSATARAAMERVLLQLNQDFWHRGRMLAERWGLRQLSPEGVEARRMLGALQRFRPGYLHSTLVLVLRAAEEHRPLLDPSLGWREHCRRLELGEVPGRHDSCVYRFPEAVAERLERALGEVSRR